MLYRFIRFDTQVKLQIVYDNAKQILMRVRALFM